MHANQMCQELMQAGAVFCHEGNADACASYFAEMAAIAGALLGLVVAMYQKQSRFYNKFRERKATIWLARRSVQDNRNRRTEGRTSGSEHRAGPSRRVPGSASQGGVFDETARVGVAVYSHFAR